MNENGLSSMGTKGSEKASLEEMIGIMFMSRTYTHMAHLKTGSFAAHKALNEFYDGILDLADSLAEVSQGLYGKMDIPFIGIDGSVTNPIGGIEAHLKRLEKLCMGCKEDYLKNIFQEVQAFYRKTLYLLKELN